MGRNTVSVGTRVDESLDEELGEYEDDHSMNRSAAVRTLIVQGLREDNNPDTGRASPYTTVGVAAVATLALGLVGETEAALALGGIVSAVAGLWVVFRTFRVSDDILQSFHDIGGFSGFLRAVMDDFRADHPIDEPTTVVERAARWDAYAPVLLLVGAIYTVVGLVGVYLGVFTPLTAVLYLLLFWPAVGAAPVVLGVSGLAMLAIASSSRWVSVGDPVDGDAGDH